MPVVTLSLIVILLTLILLGLVESKFHNNAIKKIPIRIHVNGTRGKSSVTRLIAAGLRGGGIKTLAKTTGSSPRFIDSQGDDHIIQRFRPASIGEQIRMISKFSKDKPKAISMKPCTKSRTYAITIASRPKRHLKLDLYQTYIKVSQSGTRRYLKT